MIYLLRGFCITNNYFHCGSNEQYDKFFKLASTGASAHDLAIAIYLCSDNDPLDIIESKLNKLLGSQEN